MCPLIYRATKCRLCSSNNLKRVLSLEPTPLANAFVNSSQLHACQECFPLDLFFCNNCFHVQLLDIVDPKELFENYVYVSGTSEKFVKHFKIYAESVVKYYNIMENDLVVEIGSNDGTFLSFFNDLGMKVLGIDPAKKVGRISTSKGLETLTEFFSNKLAHEIKKNYGLAKVVTANNVFAHADDLVDIVDGCRTLLEPDGLFIFEVQYLFDLYRNCYFDMIYHEHLSYHTVEPLRKFFSSNGMQIIDIKKIPTHGGSIRGVAQCQEGTRKVKSSVEEVIEEEKKQELFKAETFLHFGEKIEKLKNELQKVLFTIKSKGMSIAGYGAPAKATTLMYHFQLNKDMLDFIVDDSPLKQGLFTPGNHIPIFEVDYLYKKKPDYVLILAWNFAESIIRTHMSYLKQGGHFIIPLPKVAII